MQPAASSSYIFTQPGLRLGFPRETLSRMALMPVEFKGNRIYPSPRNTQFVFSAFNLERMQRGQSPYTIQGEQRIMGMGLKKMGLQEASMRDINEAEEHDAMKWGIEAFHQNVPRGDRNFFKMVLHHLTMVEHGPLLELNAPFHIYNDDVLHGRGIHREKQHNGKYTYQVRSGFRHTHTDIARIVALKQMVKDLNKVRRNPRIQFTHRDYFKLTEAEKALEALHATWDMNRHSFDVLRKGWWKARAADFMACVKGVPSPVEWQPVLTDAFTKLP
jgi:hypothetical protein